MRQVASALLSGGVVTGRAGVKGAPGTPGGEEILPPQANLPVDGPCAPRPPSSSTFHSSLVHVQGLP